MRLIELSVQNWNWKKASSRWARSVFTFFQAHSEHSAQISFSISFLENKASLSLDGECYVSIMCVATDNFFLTSCFPFKILFAFSFYVGLYYDFRCSTNDLCFVGLQWFLWKSKSNALLFGESLNGILTSFLNRYRSIYRLLMAAVHALMGALRCSTCSKHSFTQTHEHASSSQTFLDPKFLKCSIKKNLSWVHQDNSQVFIYLFIYFFYQYVRYTSLVEVAFFSNEKRYWEYFSELHQPTSHQMIRLDFKLV